MFETLKNSWKIKEIRNKIFFTIFIILIFRIGAVIPVPYIDVAALKAAIETAMTTYANADAIKEADFDSSGLPCVGNACKKCNAAYAEKAHKNIEQQGCSHNFFFFFGIFYKLTDKGCVKTEFHNGSSKSNKGCCIVDKSVILGLQISCAKHTHNKL